MSFDVKYFDNQLPRHLQLRLYAVKNENLDILSVENVQDILDNGLHLLGNRPPSIRNNLIQTINKHYGGFAKIRATPIWRSHIDLAVAIFNNRIQTSKNIVTRGLGEENSLAILNDLFNIDNASNKKDLAKIYATPTRRNYSKNYDLACTFLHRIPQLEEKDVKDLYQFIVEYIIHALSTGSNGKDQGNLKTLSLESVNIRSLKPDRGPMADMLDITTNLESVKELHKIWNSVDEDLPLFVESIEIVTPTNSQNYCPKKKLNGKQSNVIIITDSDEEKEEQPSCKRARVNSPPQNKTSTNKVKLTPKQILSALESPTKDNQILVDGKSNENDFKEKARALSPPQNKTSTNKLKLTPEKFSSASGSPPKNNQSLTDDNCNENDFKEKENSFKQKSRNSSKKVKKLEKQMKQEKTHTQPVNTVNNEAHSSESSSLAQKSTLYRDFSQLLKSRQFCDLKFIVGEDETEIEAHTSIVVARSEFLKEKVREAKKNLEVYHYQKLSSAIILEITFRELVPEAFKIVLHYIYTDRVKITRKIIDLLNKDIILLLVNVYQLAEQFNIKSLEEKCIKIFQENLNRCSVVEALKISAGKELKPLKELCIKFIVKNYNELVEGADFGKLDKPLIIEVIKNKEKTTDSLQLDSSNEGTTLKQDMKVFLSTSGQEFCDVFLILDNENDKVLIPAHKAVLAARCSYFKDLFLSAKPTTNAFNIPIKEIIPTPQSFTSLLQYIYHASVTMTPENCFYLYEASEFYGFTNNFLITLFEENLDKCVTAENVIQILEIANKKKSIVVKKYALNFIESNLKKVAVFPRLDTLDQTLCVDIIRVMANKRRCKNCNC